MRRKMIIALIGVIIALLVVGVVMFSPSMSKEDSNLIITSKNIAAGDPVVAKLTDSHGNPISQKKINFNITEKGGKTIENEVNTSSKGLAKLNVENDGVYAVKCTFDGDSKYSSTSVDANVSVLKSKSV